MKIGKYELRKPWVKYVTMDIEEELYWAVRKSIGEDIADDLEDSVCKCDDGKDYCKGYNNAINWAARYVRGHK